MKRYKITCNKCKGSDNLLINEMNQVQYENHWPIIAARYRPDMNWGFECGACRNDSRLAPEEKDVADILVRGASKATIKEMVKTLEMKPNTKFSMEAA